MLKTLEAKGGQHICLAEKGHHTDRTTDIAFYSLCGGLCYDSYRAGLFSADFEHSQIPGQTRIQESYQSRKKITMYDNGPGIASIMATKTSILKITYKIDFLINVSL